MFHSLESLNRIIEEVGKRDGIPDLRLSPQGTATVRFQGGIRVMFEYVEATGMLYLFCPLMPLPADPGQRAFIMEAMLEANFLRLHTGAGEFSVMRKEAQAIYQLAFEAARLDVARVSDGIDSLLRQHAECLHIIESWEPLHAQTPRRIARPPDGIKRLARPANPEKPAAARMRRL